MLFVRKQPLHVRLFEQAVGAGCQIVSMVIRNATGGTCIGFVYGVNEYTKWLTERQKQAAQIRRTPPAFSWAELVVKSSEFAMVGAIVGLAVSAANGVIRWLTD